ncbi:MAG: sensor histidine kinase [Thermoplasmatota archaeon]
MAPPPAAGLALLERPVGRVRWATWATCAAGIVAAGVVTYVAVQHWGAKMAAPRLVAAVAALVILVVGFGALAWVAVSRFGRAAAVAVQQRAALDTVILTLPDGLVVADKHRYRANAAAQKLYSLAPVGPSPLLLEALQRLDVRDHATGYRIPMEAGVLSAALAGRATAMDQAVTTPEGDRHLHVTGVPIRFPEAAPGGLVLVSDITQRLATQAALKAARDRLEAQNAERLRMVRAIAHDLSNALSPATLQHGLLERGRGDSARSIEVMGRSLAQMSRLVHDLSDMARLESGALALDRRPADLGHLVGLAVDSFLPIAQQKGVHLSLATPEAIPVKADPERLGQVLTNLLNNAVKFTPPGGHVQVSARVVSGEARVEVQDSGMGLRRDQIDLLFKAFSQVHEPGSVSERGTGLGLFISKGLIEGHGGHIGVESGGPGKGSTFWFTMPAA